MSHFAKALSELRQAAGDSMQSLADKAKVSKSMISKIERNEVQPTLDVAGRLAKAFGKTLSEMLHAPKSSNIIFLPKQEQAVWEGVENITRRNISPIFEGLQIEWLQLTFPINATVIKAGMIPAPEKHFLVTKGKLSIEINQQTYQLTPGDSIYFNGCVDHVIKNIASESTEFYLVMHHKKENS
jgi:transcriptional regulator with XRE-family HTH domain